MLVPNYQGEALSTWHHYLMTGLGGAGQREDQREAGEVGSWAWVKERGASGREGRENEKGVVRNSRGKGPMLLLGCHNTAQQTVGLNH